MSKQAEVLSNGVNHTAVDLGTFKALMEYEVTNPTTGKPFPGKVFLSEILQLTGMEVSLQIFPPGTGMPFAHRHRENEELYLILAGCGEYTVDGVTIPLQEGSALRVAPEGVRIWRNTGEQPMVVMCVQAVADSLRNATIKDGMLVK